MARWGNEHYGVMRKAAVAAAVQCPPRRLDVVGGAEVFRFEPVLHGLLGRVGLTLMDCGFDRLGDVRRSVSP